MWGRGAAANLSKQQEQFCTSLKDDIDDSEAGWGTVEEPATPLKSGWGSSAGSRPPTTGWGTKNPQPVVRGWGASQSPAPPPDLTSKLKPQTAVKAKVESKPAASAPPTVNGWGKQAQPLKSTETEKQAKPPNLTGDKKTDGISQGSAPASKNVPRLYSQVAASGQNSRSENPRTQTTQTKPLGNGSTSSAPSPAARTPPAPQTPNTRPRPSAAGGPNAWNVAKQMAARGYIPLKPRATTAESSTNQAQVNSSAPSRDNVASAPQAKITPSKTAATIQPQGNAAGNGASVGQKKTDASESARDRDVAQKKTDRVKSTGPVVGTTGASASEAQDKGTPQANQRKDMFILAQSESERFKELILLLESHPLRRPAMLIVDKSRTDPILLSALLSLSGFPAAPMNVKCARDPASIRVICTDDLRGNASRVSLIVNVDMVDEFDQIGERMKYLEKNGVMKTIFLPSKDSVRATNFASKLQDCGLPVPHQLEPFLSCDDQE